MIPQEIEDSLIDYFYRTRSISINFKRIISLTGGCINNVYRLQTSIGDFCLKFNLHNRFPQMFTSEADGLSLLKTAGEIYVPDVLFTGESGLYDFLLLEFINQGKNHSLFMQDFGRSLAKLHKHSNCYFGHKIDNYMGSLPQCNNRKRSVKCVLI